MRFKESVTSALKVQVLSCLCCHCSYTGERSKSTARLCYRKQLQSGTVNWLKDSSFVLKEYQFPSALSIELYYVLDIVFSTYSLTSYTVFLSCLWLFDLIYDSDLIHSHCYWYGISIDGSFSGNKWWHCWLVPWKAFVGTFQGKIWSLMGQGWRPLQPRNLSRVH